MEPDLNTCTAFAGTTCIAKGTTREVATKVKKHLDAHPEEHILVFDDVTSGLVEIDFRGSLADVITRLPDESNQKSEKSGPGRPKLGVVSREIGLLPRHWEWLALQPGGASVTLRKLVEDAKKLNRDKDKIRQSQNSAYKFMSAMAGDLVHFEEATRAFFASNRSLFETLTAGWPKDLREHALMLGEAALDAKGTL